jgi:flavodoxin short chain
MEVCLVKSVAIIYWSGTGNTKKMAEAIREGIEAQGVAAQLLSVEEASVADVTGADAAALGCPSMGAEVLEEEYMEPFVAELTTIQHNQKPLALFGSYDWGNGEWMRDWQQRMTDCKFKLVDDGLIVRNEPGAEGVSLCKELGAKLAKVL